MNILKNLPEIFTFGILPFLLLILFIYTLWKMLQAGVEKPPILSILISLLHYGGMAFLLSYKLFLEWDSFAVMALGYLSAFAPILEIILGTIGIKRYRENVFHRWNVRLAFGYPILVSIVFMIIYIKN